jgi:hypothetical protein
VLTVVGRVREPVQIAAGAKSSLTVDVTNTGRAYWPSYREHENPAGVVKLALQWHPHARHDVLVANDRWPLAVSMLPGDRMRMLVPLTAATGEGRALAPGDYDLAITMVREGFALFPPEPEGTRWLRVRVAAAATPAMGPEARVQARAAAEWRRRSASTIVPSS